MAGCGCATPSKGKMAKEQANPGDIVIAQGTSFEGITLCNSKCSNIAIRCLKKNAGGNGSFTVEDAFSLQGAVVGDKVILTGLPVECVENVCATITAIADREVTLNIPFPWLKDDIRVTGGFAGSGFLGIEICPGAGVATEVAVPMVQILIAPKNYAGLIQIGDGVAIGGVWTAQGMDFARIETAERSLVGKRLNVGSIAGWYPTILRVTKVQGNKKVVQLSAPAPAAVDCATATIEPHQLEFTFVSDACGCKKVVLSPEETAKLAAPEVPGCKPGQKYNMGRYWIWEVDAASGDRSLCQEGCVWIRPGAYSGGALVSSGGTPTGC